MFAKKTKPKEWLCHARMDGTLTVVEDFTKTRREAGEDATDEGFRFFVEAPSLEEAMYAAGVRKRRLIDISQVNDGTGLCRVNLVEKQKERIREAVRLAVEEERARCAKLVRDMTALPASEYAGVCVVDMDEASALIRKAPK